MANVMGIRLIAFVLLLKFLALNLCCNEAAKFKFTNLACESRNKSWISVNTCRLRAVSRNKTTLSINITLLHPAERNIRVEGQFFQKANGYKPWLYNISVDICRFIKKPYNPIAILVYRMVKEYSNINHTCPFVGLITVKDMVLKLDSLPNALPTGEYRMRVNWYINNKLQLRNDIYFVFEENL